MVHLIFGPKILSVPSADSRDDFRRVAKSGRRTERANRNLNNNVVFLLDRVRTRLQTTRSKVYIRPCQKAEKIKMKMSPRSETTFREWRGELVEIENFSIHAYKRLARLDEYSPNSIPVGRHRGRLSHVRMVYFLNYLLKCTILNITKRLFFKKKSLFSFCLNFVFSFKLLYS